MSSSALSSNDNNGRVVVLSYEEDAGSADSTQPASCNNNINTTISNKSSSYRSIPIIYLNGSRLPSSLAQRARPNQTLLDFLRSDVGLTGSKLGCGEGGCGACTVLISRYDASTTSTTSTTTTPTNTAASNNRNINNLIAGTSTNNNDDDEDDDFVAKHNQRGKIIHTTVNACLYPVLAADGCHVTTIEGVGSWRTKNSRSRFLHASSNTNDEQQQQQQHEKEAPAVDEEQDYLHPIQRAMVDMHGSQCGFCTPGIIMALYGLLTVDDDDDDEKRREAATSTGANPNVAAASVVVAGPKVAHLEEHLDGNLCRCTGYRPIWDAARSLCVDGLTATAVCRHHHHAQKQQQQPNEGNDPEKDVEDAQQHGPCGLLCNECPEREVCEMECNAWNDTCVSDTKDCHGYDQGTTRKSTTTTMSPTDKKKVYSCTQSKVAGYRSIMESAKSNMGGRWWDQPNDMFPKELILDDARVDKSSEEIRRLLAQPLKVVDTSIHNGGMWLKPTSLPELLDLFREYSSSSSNHHDDGITGGGVKLVVGNTEVGIETKFKHARYPRLVHPSESIHTLYDIFATEDNFVIGGCASLSRLQKFCQGFMPTVDTVAARDNGDGARSRTAKPIYNMLRWFASTQIRNVACLGGNLATASPISDMNPLLCALGATLVLASRSKPDGGIVRRHVSVSDFFRGYRTVDKTDMEVIERIDIPLVRSNFEYVAPFKQARRREDDISIVTSGMRIKISPEVSSGDDGDDDRMHWVIRDVSIAFGGMAPVTKMAKETMEFLIGKSFGETTFVDAQSILRNEFSMPDDVPGGQAKYRLTLACSFLYKFYLFSVGELRKDVEVITSKLPTQLPPLPIIPNDEECGVNNGFMSAPKPSIGGVQCYPTPKVAVGLEGPQLGCYGSDQGIAQAGIKKQEPKEGVGKPATHASGPLHCTGEAEYADDIPAPENLLHGSLILASKCHVKLVNINVSPALLIPGVAGAFTHKDIIKLGGDNRMGPIVLDDVAFLPVGEKVEFVGQVLGIVVAASQDIAAEGARAVDVEYSDELEGKAIVSIEDAINAKSFWVDSIHEMHRGGDVETILQLSDIGGKRLVVVEGSIRSGGQEHFYLEPNSTLAIPSESATNLTIFASTQAPTKTQDFCARVTNTPAAKVVVRVKRMGGGFGGKETRSVFSSVAAAVAAKLTNRPVRLTLNRDTDMSITGGRHAFLAKYKAGAIIGECGTVKLHALDVQLFNNGGCKFDLTGPVLDRALFHVDNCYYWPNFHSVGIPCKTSQPPHTAFRGFGGPQGMVVCEHIIDHLALACNVSVDKLRCDNLYTLEDSTPFGMRFGGEFTGKWNIPRMWNQLYKELDVPRRRQAADYFNSKNKWKKRGVGFIPTKFGIAFTAKFMNQGGALVHLYTDGTVLVSHGGTEMGQGLHTKVCQVAAQAFGIPLNQVYVNDSSTDKVANTLPSAASMSTDLYGMAVLDACQKILKRIKPIRDSLPPGSALAAVAQKAFYERVDLSAHGFFALDDDRCGYEWNKKKPEMYPDKLPENSWKGHPFNYFTQGVALAEVEIDVLTGDHRTIRADVLVDVGSSINPAIDVGQIEGAFLQGMGWCTIEEVIYADDDHTWIRPRAKVFTQGPGTYKIPAFNDVPEKFNVTLLEDADNPFAVHSSKAVGEPPFFLGCSVFYAIKDAVTAARGGSEYFEFRMPATSERIRMACGDRLSLDCVGSPIGDTFQPMGSY